MASIEAQNRVRQLNLCRSISLGDPAPDSRCAKSIEIDEEKGEVTRNISATDTLAELDAVENLNLTVLVEADMVCSEIAMTFANPSFFDSVREELMPVRTEFAHRRDDVSELNRRQRT